MKKALCLIISFILLFNPVNVFAASYGVDVSHNNGSVDYALVKENGISFAMIRLGYFNHLDNEFFNNVKAVSETNMEYGVYLYSYAVNDEEAKTEADFVINTANGLGELKKNFTLPVAYDVEDKQLETLGKEQINRNKKIFTCIIYYVNK